MMIEITDADNYLANHLFNDNWVSADSNKKRSALDTSERMIKSSFKLKAEIDDIAIEDTTQYLHAVCEMSIHLLNFDKERFKMQQEGVTSYGVSDVSFQMENSLFSPVVMGFINKIRVRVGDIV